MPDQESRIAAWRTTVTAALPHAEEVVAELEAHLRDQIDALVAAGMPGPEAFELAVRRLGDPTAMAREFQRMPSAWFGTVRSRELRLLAYSAGVAGLAGCVNFTAAAWYRTHQLLMGKPSALAPGMAVFWIVMAGICAVLCAGAMRGSGRFLKVPGRRDARGVVAFNLLVVWVLFSGWISPLRLVHELKLALIGLVLIGLAWLWRTWMRQVMESRPDSETAE